MLFVNLPPVLQLQLKRFEYDFQRDTMVKVGGGRQLVWRGGGHVQDKRWVWLFDGQGRG